jgi:predicted RNA methylase
VSEGLQFYPTPEESVGRLVDSAMICQSDSVLEPSFGDGRIIAEVWNRKPSSVVGVELDVGRFLALPERTGQTKFCCDFLLMAWPDSRRFSRVVMNPPFNPDLDVRHVLHAFDHALAVGGLLVAIVSERWILDPRLTNLVLFYERLPDNPSPGATEATWLIAVRK